MRVFAKTFSAPTFDSSTRRSRSALPQKVNMTNLTIPKLTCTPRGLPPALHIEAAARAVQINPANHPSASVIAHALGSHPTQARIAILVGKRWHTKGVHLSVGFLDGPTVELRKHILSHMNAWSATANVKFRYSKTDPKVRVSRSTPPPNDGYWSYLGTDILSISNDEPTMNLQDFTMAMPESEFIRVVRHETGHTLGFPHEHMRRELVDKIDPEKAIKFFRATQGWDAEMVRAQVLTPIEESSLIGTDHADPSSIMCYQIPGSITKDALPIIGGVDIDPLDAAFAGSIYPKKAPQ